MEEEQQAESNNPHEDWYNLFNTVSTITLAREQGITGDFLKKLRSDEYILAQNLGMKVMKEEGKF